MRGDVTKLPKWAQAEIARLTRDLEHERAKLTAGPEDSDTFADPYATAPRPLGRGTTIKFQLGEKRHECLHVRTQAGKLYVQGGDRVTVYPVASNVIEVRAESQF